MSQTIKQWLAMAKDELSKSGSESPRTDAECLIGHLLDKPRTYLFTWDDQLLDEQQLQSLQALLCRRTAGEPVAYIIGYREFWSLKLKVNPSTLIPRPDTETLVEWSLELPLLATAPVLDLGTGTGAIALALASEQPSWSIQAVDFSLDAVRLASDNARDLGLDRVRVFQSDWFANVSGRYDLIVSNPPYIDSEDGHLVQGDLRFEPDSALVAEGSGLADIEQIVAQAPNFLNAEGWLLLEHGYQQAEAVQELLQRAGFQKVESRRDLSGNLRVTAGCWPAQRLA
jgi:release factor glutamine methyltransferase